MTSIPRDLPLSTLLRVPPGDPASSSTAPSAAIQPSAGSRRETTASRRSVPTKSDAVGQMAQWIAQLSKEDPDRKRKAFRIVVECAMVEKWGQHLQLDPGFAQLVSRVQDQMDGDPELALMIEQAAAQVLASSQFK
jgi:hypothetical protein